MGHSVQLVLAYIACIGETLILINVLLKFINYHKRK